MEQIFQGHRVFTYTICQRLLEAASNYDVFTPAIQSLCDLVEERQDVIQPFSGNPGITTLDDLSPGMILRGQVCNIERFGVFVDVGVLQNGLVHISQLVNRFVNDPHDVVKIDDVVMVKVLDVEPEHKRLSLSMKSVRQDVPDQAVKRLSSPPPSNLQPLSNSILASSRASDEDRRDGSQTAMAEAFAKA